VTTARELDALFAPNVVQRFFREHNWAYKLLSPLMLGVTMGSIRGLWDHSPTAGIVYGLVFAVVMSPIYAWMNTYTWKQLGFSKKDRAQFERWFTDPRNVGLSDADKDLFSQMLKKQRRKEAGLGFCVFLGIVSIAPLAAAVVQFTERAWVVSVGWAMLSTFTTGLATHAFLRAKDLTARYAAAESLLERNTVSAT
jgi:hypothetical protein